MFQIPIALVTVWHPEEYAKLLLKQLSLLPSLKKDRKAQESRKAEIARATGRDTTTDVFHKRPIINFGNPKSLFRRSWLNGKDLTGLMADYSFRLIDTEETGTQARFKLEARPNWGTEPNILPNNLISRIHENLSRAKLSVRQVWVNPFGAGADKALNGAFYDLGHTMNLVLGPCDDKMLECTRRAAISFRRHWQSVPLHQHCAFYDGSITAEAGCVLPHCNFWWAEYK